MRFHTVSICAIVVVTFFIAAPSALGQIGASGDTGQPSQTTNYMSGGGFNIFENVALDSAFGPWHKLLTNSDGGHSSGQNVFLNETLTNVGSAAWTDWHEEIVSRTTINNPNDAPGYLFRSGSLVVRADYGSGVVTLTQGTEYTITTTPYSGPNDPGGNNGNWEAISIFFAPGFEIAPGNVLRIEKSIFEVFLDGNIWMNGDAAEIAEYPTSVPEPASVAVFAVGITILARRRR